MFWLVQILFCLEIVCLQAISYRLIMPSGRFLSRLSPLKTLLWFGIFGLVAGILSCLVRGNFLFFLHVSSPKFHLVSDGVTWLYFLIVLVLCGIRVLGHFLHWNAVPGSKTSEVLEVFIPANELVMQANLNPTSALLVDEYANKQVARWNHDGLSEFIIFSQTVRAQDMVVTLRKRKENVWLCETVRTEEKPPLKERLVTAGLWVARISVLAGMLVANYDTWYLPAGTFLPEQSSATGLIGFGFLYLMFAHIWLRTNETNFGKYEKFWKIAAPVFCVLAVIFWIFIVPSQSFRNGLIYVYDDNRTIYHAPAWAEPVPDILPGEEE